MKRKKKRARWWQELRRVVWSLGVVVVVAGGLTGWFALHHLRSGRYLAKNVLLSPSLLLGGCEPQDIGSKQQLQRSWVFERVEMIQGSSHILVPPRAYAQLYDRMAPIRSCKGAKEELQVAFARQGVVRLRLVLTPQGKYAATLSPHEYLEVQVAPRGDLVRVELSEARDTWAYFRVPGALQLLSGRAA